MASKMTNSFFKIPVFALVIILWGAGPSFAQRCDLDYEAIFKLRAPSIGAYNIWDGVHGDPNMSERYISGIVLENKNVFVAGERVGASDATPPKPPMLIMAEVDRRGRIVWQKDHEIEKLSRLHKIFRNGDQVVALGDIDQGKDPKARINSVWIGFFDLQGNMKSQKFLKQGADSLYAHDLIPLSKGKGFLLAASVEKNRSAEQRVTMLYRLNNKAEIVSKRSYVPGPDNRILNMSALSEDTYIASGFINDDKGRRTGWMMVVDADGNVIWQRQYPRGAGAQIDRAVPFAKEYIALVGTAYPAVADGNTAGWVMVVYARNGEIAWQRYFTGDFDYVARDLMVNSSGLISVLLDGNPPKSRKQPKEEGDSMHEDFVRLLTLNPRGVILDNSDFFNGEGADAYSLMLGPADERIIMGASMMAYEIEAVDPGAIMGPMPQKPQEEEGQKPSEEEKVMKHSLEGWLLAAPAMEAYEDPCTPKPLRVPDDE